MCREFPSGWPRNGIRPVLRPYLFPPAVDTKLRARGIFQAQKSGGMIPPHPPSFGHTRKRVWPSARRCRRLAEGRRRSATRSREAARGCGGYVPHAFRVSLLNANPYEPVRGARDFSASAECRAGALSHKQALDRAQDQSPAKIGSFPGRPPRRGGSAPPFD